MFRHIIFIILLSLSMTQVLVKEKPIKLSIKQTIHLGHFTAGMGGGIDTVNNGVVSGDVFLVDADITTAVVHIEAKSDHWIELTLTSDNTLEDSQGLSMPIAYRFANSNTTTQIIQTNNKGKASVTIYTQLTVPPHQPSGQYEGHYEVNAYYL